MTDSQWSSLEKEPFLPGQSSPLPRPPWWSFKGAVAAFLASQIILFAMLGGLLVLVVQNSVKEISLNKVQSNTTLFGGLPVQFNDPVGPYVICPAAGGPEAAHKAGCSFDLFANGWVPQPCFDAETHDFFLNQRDYYFWADKEKRVRVHQDTLMRGTLEYPELYVSFEEHYEHCRYLLNSTLRYAQNPSLGVMEIHMDSEHMAHCIDFLRESRDPYNLEENVIAYFGHRKCYLPRLT